MRRCRNCVPACPFDVIVMHPPADPADVPELTEDNKAFGVATKCDRCLTTAGAPACVTGCPYGAVARGRPEALFPGLTEWADGV